MEKRELKLYKNKIKNDVLPRLFKNCEQSKVSLNPITREWEISLRLNISIPAGMEAVIAGSIEDAQRQEVLQYMKEQRNSVQSKIENVFGVHLRSTDEVLKANKTYKEFNFTQPFPPGFITRKEGNRFRLITEQEVIDLDKKAPEMVNFMKRDLKMLEEGYFEFNPDTDANLRYDIEAFKLKKYSTIRAYYEFNVPHEYIEGLKEGNREKVFSAIE